MEFRRHPELRGQPVIVGGNGDPQEARKVVTCASYPARPYGVRAGMPLRAAARKCPDAIFLPLDIPSYDDASAEVMQLLRGFTDQVEVWGWDEAFVAVDTDNPEHVAERIRAAVTDLDLTCAIGIGDNKLTAKLATGFAKSVGKSTDTAADLPGARAGTFRLTAANWAEEMADRPTDALWGVGNRIAARLAELDIHTVGELMAADRNRLAAEFGPTNGPYLWVLGRGAGDTELVTEPPPAVGHSKSETFPHDLTARTEVQAQLTRLAAAVTADISAQGRTAIRVSVTVRTNTFYTRSKQAKLGAPTTDVGAITEAALRILDRFPLDRPVRLLGVRLELAPPPAPADS